MILLTFELYLSALIKLVDETNLAYVVAGLEKSVICAAHRGQNLPSTP